REYVELLRRSLRVTRADKLSPHERALIVPSGKRAALVDARRAQVQVNVSARDGSQWAWSWPDAFKLVRPGVLELASPRALAPRPKPPADEDIGVIRQPLHGAPHRATGQLMCRGNGVPFLKVVIAGQRTQTG